MFREPFATTCVSWMNTRPVCQKMVEARLDRFVSAAWRDAKGRRLYGAAWFDLK